MKQEEIRKEVRRVLREAIEKKSVYPVSGQNNMFPIFDNEEIVRLPEEINPSEEYLVNWNGVSDNNDLYSFPMDEFKKGLHVEKAKNSIFNILDISKIVINNLEVNPRFYSNLGV